MDEELVELYEYTPAREVLLEPWDAARILETRRGRLRLSLTGHVVGVESSGDEVVLSVDGREWRIPVSELERAASSRKVYVLGKGLRPVEVRWRHYYKLVPVGPGVPPTLEIDGIHMHRVKGTDPLRDTRAKLRAARVGRGHRVLDTCMGLGYTAVGSVKRGASYVLTVEVDEAVILVSRFNPWSWGLADERVDLVHGDAARIVGLLADESFDRVIHDPPRLSSSTGALYGIEFYRELYRVLRRGGVLFHYTGEPGRKRRLGVPGKVASRLRRAGFRVLGYDKEAQGVVAVRER